jgi:hypothetical protein
MSSDVKTFNVQDTNTMQHIKSVNQLTFVMEIVLFL